jgi:hypothetical protein
MFLGFFLDLFDRTFRVVVEIYQVFILSFKNEQESGKKL